MKNFLNGAVVHFNPKGSSVSTSGNGGVAIKYGDVAFGAKENFKPSIDGLEEFSNASVLQKNNVSFVNYGVPNSPYSVLLDGSVVPFPDQESGKTFGVWSKELSGEDGFFATPLVLSLKASELFSSSGITMVFDEQQNIFPCEVLVAWYRGEEKIEEEQFFPNSSNYFFSKKVDYYDGVEVRFIRMNAPFNRLKIHSIDYGIGVIFYGDELRRVKMSQSIDPISTEIEINTCDFDVDSKRDVEYSFQSQQPISVYFNGKLQSTCFVESAKRTSKNGWSVKAEDYIGLMDSIPYFGGIYNERNADEIIADIFSVAKIPYDLEDMFVGIKVSGYIPYTTCRTALMQVAFAIGAVVSTAGLDLVKVYSLSDEVSQKIPEERVLVGQSISEKNVVTAVELVEHSFVETNEEDVVYEADKSGEGESIFVSFGDPLHSLSIENGDIHSSGVNYAVITARYGCVLKGKKYKHNTVTKTKRNPVVSSSDIENIVSIKDATLVSRLNVDKLLSKCYNYIVSSKQIKTKIIDGKHITAGSSVKYGQARYGNVKYGSRSRSGGAIVYDKPTNVGDIVTVPVEFLKESTARIIKQTFSLVGGITVKDSELR